MVFLFTLCILFPSPQPLPCLLRFIFIRLFFQSPSPPFSTLWKLRGNASLESFVVLLFFSLVATIFHFFFFGEQFSSLFSFSFLRSLSSLPRLFPQSARFVLFSHGRRVFSVKELMSPPPPLNGPSLFDNSNVVRLLLFLPQPGRFFSFSRLLARKT